MLKFKILWREQINFAHREQRKNADDNRISRCECLAEVPQKIINKCAFTETRATLSKSPAPTSVFFVSIFSKQYLQTNQKLVVEHKKTKFAEAMSVISGFLFFIDTKYMQVKHNERHKCAFELKIN